MESIFATVARLITGLRGSPALPKTLTVSFPSRVETTRANLRVVLRSILTMQFCNEVSFCITL
jgi:hypothetical protein